MPKPENTGSKPDQGRALGQDRPLDEATGRKEHPHGQPPGPNRPPKEERPREEGDDAQGHDAGGTQPNP